MLRTTQAKLITAESHRGSLELFYNLQYDNQFLYRHSIFRSILSHLYEDVSKKNITARDLLDIARDLNKILYS